MARQERIVRVSLAVTVEDGHEREMKSVLAMEAYTTPEPDDVVDIQANIQQAVVNLASAAVGEIYQGMSPKDWLEVKDALTSTTAKRNAKCVACGGTGKSSKGNSCIPCDGTGKQKEKR